MASGTVQHSNRDNAGDFIEENSVTHSCGPCMKSNITKTATDFCEDCDEFICDACTNQHKHGKHKIGDFSDKKYAPVIKMKGMDICQEHGRKLEFYCQDHSKLCCSSCVLIHRKCEKVDEITKESTQTRPVLKTFTQSLIKLQSEADAIKADCKRSKTGIKESITKICSEVDNMKNHIIKLFDDAKQKLITEAKQFKTTEVKRIGNRRDASSKLKEEISKVLSMCSVVLERGTPSQQFIYLEQMKEKRKTIESTIDDQRKITFATVTVSFPKEVTSLLKMDSNCIKLNYDGNTTVETSPICLSSQPMPIALELLVSVDLHKTGDQEKEPYLTGLDFLPDERLVAVDNKNKKCIILDERLHILGTPYKFKYHPCSVVCVSHDVLCVTFGIGKVVYLLSVSTDNTIRLTREMITSSNVSSICCMSPSQMVVSMFDDPRPARMLSVDGVESDFNHFLTLPMKTYTEGESKCTYVQSKNTLVLTDKFAHTVYLYDTVKGTSRAVTNENIQQPCGCCVGPGDTVLVSSENKRSIVHLSVDGQILGTYPVNMKYLRSICVSKEGTRLAVSNNLKGATKIHLYKISAAMS